MYTALLVATCVALHGPGAGIPQKETLAADQMFREYWGTDFEWKFSELPTEGTVSTSRVPYSGYIYLDTAGGTIRSLRKYDAAFSGRRYLASGHEQWDTTAFAQPTMQRGGLFGMRTVTVMQTPNWHGHCNGWAAAAIRHAEPQRSVTRNGVVFSPADIKGLLAEMYIYNDILELAGSDYTLNAGLLHATLGNWLGRGAHPIGMESDPGPEKWNYPVYGYATSSAKRSDREVEVKVNIAYAKDSNGEFQQSPRYQRTKYFHYMLSLDDEGRITGGYYFRDSSMIDLLWVPLRPKQGRQPGNERGNPYVDVDKVLAIWRDSVDEDLRQSWTVIDPPAEDRISDVARFERLVPLQDPHAPPAAPEESTGAELAAADAAPAAEGTDSTSTPTPAASNAAESQPAASELESQPAVTEAAAEPESQPAPASEPAGETTPPTDPSPDATVEPTSEEAPPAE